MMEQLPLVLGHQRARRADPATSHAAAVRVSEFASDHCRLILESLREDGPQTIYELAARTRLSHVQIARRLPELAKAGFASPQEETRPGPTGRGCRVWSIA